MGFKQIRSGNEQRRKCSAGHCKESALSKHWNRNQHCGFKSAEVEMKADRKCSEDVKHERRQA